MYIPSQPQVIKRDKLEGLAVILAWVFGVVVPIIISTFGNYVAFVGGWENFTLPLSGKAILIAVLWQATCCACQFAFKVKGWWIAYAVALVVSVAPTFIGYNVPVREYLEPILLARLDKLTVPLIMLFTAIGAFLLDALPEWIIVESETP